MAGSISRSAFDIDGDDDAEKADDYRGYLASQGFELLDDTDLPTFNGQNGDAKFTSGGLYNAKVTTLTTDSFDAQGLLAIGRRHAGPQSFAAPTPRTRPSEAARPITGQGLAAQLQGLQAADQCGP